MKHQILDLVNRYWKFDNDQQPVSGWHDKQDLLKELRKILKANQCDHSDEKIWHFEREGVTVCECGKNIKKK